MAKFEIGDQVQMPGVPVVVEVLEIGTCDDSDSCCAEETFRFVDPAMGEDDWAHASEFEKVPA